MVGILRVCLVVGCSVIRQDLFAVMGDTKVGKTDQMGRGSQKEIITIIAREAFGQTNLEQHC